MHWVKKNRKKRRGMEFIPYDYEAAFNKNIEELHELFVEQMLKHRRKCVYALKEITAGEQFEIEIYPEFKNMDEVPEGGKEKKDNTKAQKNLNDKNARKYLERLINHNFEDSDIWVTLTYSEGNEPDTWENATKDVQNYIRRIAYRRKKKGLPNTKYVYIIEYSPEDEIRWHNHIIMDGLLDMDTVEAAWKLGRRNETRRLEKDEHGLTGMSIYITKDKNRKKGEKRWNCSQNLKQFRVRKVHSKRPAATAGTYKPIEKYVEGFVKDRAVLEDQLHKWYPALDFTDAEIYYNDFNGMFYIRARMRKRKEIRKEGEMHRRAAGHRKTRGEPGRKRE